MTDRAPLDTLLDQCERIVAIHEHLRMDTEEDERVRLKGVEIGRRALAQCRDYVERVRALGPRPDVLAVLTTTPVVDDPTRATTAPPLRALSVAEAGRVLAALRADGYEVVKREGRDG